MNTIPLSSLAPTTRARLEALAVEWLGFDLGVRLYAELEHISVADAHANLRDDPMRIGVETPADRQPEARLRVILLDLGRE